MYMYSIEKENVTVEEKILTGPEVLGELLQLSVMSPIVTHYAWMSDKEEHKVVEGNVTHTFTPMDDTYSINVHYVDSRTIRTLMSFGSLPEILDRLKEANFPEANEIAEQVTLLLDNINDKEGLRKGEHFKIGKDGLDITISRMIE